MERFTFLSDIAIADAAFEAYGKDYNELFAHCAEAVTTEMIDLRTLDAVIKKTITLEHEDIGKLLYDFLSEILYLKDAEQLLFKEYVVTIVEHDGTFTLTADMKGEKINPHKHALGSDVKAITLHMFSIVKEKDYYKAKIIIDI